MRPNYRNFTQTQPQLPLSPFSLPKIPNFFLFTNPRSLDFFTLVARSISAKSRFRLQKMVKIRSSLSSLVDRR
ncbi:hypothetical protein L6452_16291 [Arctium lappa]|uniref:Uncharacterized protein n=1 Tax=Arctium lappa TaxID=4217 RepID=A0ACB9C0B1_ARCLA|nr:hypothetical protein L6452_16291 [Arctium lappa]